VIDHHIDNEFDVPITIVDPTLSSTCEIVYKMLMQEDESLINQTVATALLLGILTDT
jgi:bifunctional oligoribonuclease and PAP phosphatase NrnA